MNPKNLISINQKIKNVSTMELPYWAVFSGEVINKSGNKRVIFFGNDLGTFRNMGVDVDRYLKKCNECLDYIRREFSGYDLLFKPHPVDKEEEILLDLSGFNLITEKINSELFLFKNRENIKAVFSLGSASAYSAYAMGLNTYVFYKYFDGLCGDELTWQFDDFYSDMPQSFFIKNLDQGIKENAKLLKQDLNFTNFLKDNLKNHNGKIWFTVFTTEHIVLFMSLAKMIKTLNPTRPIGLLISHHNYWSMINPDDFKKYFDDITILPRVRHSLRPTQILNAVKTAFRIKRIKISKNDILIFASQAGFVENCIASYNRNSLRVALIPDKDFNLFYNTKNSIYSNHNNFKFNKASWLFNKIIEPLLGLQRTLWMFYGKGSASFIVKYQKPLNEVFDKLIILKARV